MSRCAVPSRLVVVALAVVFLFALPAGAAPLRVALLPILDSLPFYVARQQGYFAAVGLAVRDLPVSSALERDQLMQVGRTDGMLSEMTVTANFNRKRVRVKILAAARAATPVAPLFRIVAAPGSGISAPVDLAGVPVGVSTNTIIEYVTDRLLQAGGLSGRQIVTRSVPSIPERFQLILQGRLAAGTLPDPLAQSALEAGARLVVDDTARPGISVSTLTFSQAVITRAPDAVRAFLAAWDRAAADINHDPQRWRPLLLEKIRVPSNVRATFRVPPFPRRTVPSRAQWNDVMAWMVDKGLLNAPLAYADSVSAAFLPAGD